MTPKHDLLVVEDDETTRHSLDELLTQSGDFEVVAVAGIDDALAALSGQTFDAALLDVGLPERKAGLYLCGEIRRRVPDCPIIMVTGYRGSEDLVGGLEAGADDYVCKPFAITELAARIRACLRRRDTTTKQDIRLGPVTIDLGTRMVTRSGSHDHDRACSLTERECGVLRHLLRAGGQAISRGELAREVFGYASAVQTTTVETHIYNLRRKVEIDPSRPQYVINVRDRGYALVNAHYRHPGHSP